jgi:hypothetical protein
MAEQTATRVPATGLRSLGRLRWLLGLSEGACVSDKPWLTIKEVVDLVRAAGYTDSADTVRRAIDVGRYGTEGKDWYRTDSGYRMVTPAAVAANIERRRQPRE